MIKKLLLGLSLLLILAGAIPTPADAQVVVSVGHRHHRRYYRHHHHYRHYHR